jgi:hypothetical protein
MILYQMVSGKVPFAKMGNSGEDLSPIQNIYKRRVGGVSNILLIPALIMKVGIENLRPEIPAHCPVGLRHLISLAWDKVSANICF